MPVSFDFQKRLGAGYFGEVWLARETGLNIELAVKLIPPSKVINPTNFFQEAQLLKTVEHSNVVRVHDTGELSDGRLYVSMEYLPKGSLEDEAAGAYVPLTRAKRLAIDLLRGLEHAHSRSVVHRDIKPGNILIGPNGEGKLSDFGLAFPAGTDLKALGVKGYAYQLHVAPEVLGANDYNVRTDIYACGVTLYRLVNGDALLPAITPVEVKARARKGKFPDRNKYRDFVPRPLRLVINKAMAVDPAERYASAAQMRHAIERIPFEKNWTEKALREGVEWTCGWDKRCYHVTRVKVAGGKWSVIVRKGQSRSQLRRIANLCLAGVTKTNAEQHCRRVLQDFVLGRLK